MNENKVRLLVKDLDMMRLDKFLNFGEGDQQASELSAAFQVRVLEAWNNRANNKKAAKRKRQVFIHACSTTFFSQPLYAYIPRTHFIMLCKFTEHVGTQGNSKR